jgi:Sporulation and spore germination
MEEQKSVSRNMVATAISALAVGATVAGAGVAWFMTQNHTQSNVPATIAPSAPTMVKPTQIDPPTVNPATVIPNQTAVPPTIPSQLPTVGEKITTPIIPSIAQTQEKPVKIWRLDDDGKKTFLVPQERPEVNASSSTPEVRVQKSMSGLIASAGKLDGKLTSTIPVGTKLLSTKILADGIHVDLSKEFTQGFGATSMIGRLGQVVYTATEADPDAQVWITVEGKKLEVFGDVGVEIRQPITRQTYNQDFPINPVKSTNPRPVN